MSDWVLLFGSVILIGACIAVVAFASNSYSKSKVLAGAVLTSEPWAPVELVCGMRIGLMMASWPGGRFRLGPDSVALLGQKAAGCMVQGPVGRASQAAGPADRLGPALQLVGDQYTDRGRGRISSRACRASN
jgi:hypothetical protein